MEIINWIITHAEKIGIVAILIIVIWGLIYVIKLLYSQAQNCEKSRLDDYKERAELNKKLGGLEAKIQTLEELNHKVLLSTLRK